MTRIFKFRVWSLLKKEMAEIQDYPSLLFQEKGRWFAMNGDKLFCNFMAGTLMQFTGLTDKNGKDIYEGDIIRCYDKDGEKVLDQEVKIPLIYQEIWGNQADAQIEVIGNIYENENLMQST